MWDYWQYALIIVAFYLLQVYMSYRQMEHFKRTILKYRDKGIMGLGVKKSRFGSGKVAVLVSDDKGNIIIAKIMSGVSVFARFRNKAELIGKSIDDLLMSLPEKGKEQIAIRGALLQIQEKLKNCAV